MGRTGSPREPSPQSRTRDTVDHAGHSPPLVPLRELTSTSTDLWNLSLSNNLWTALNLSETTDAEEVSWTTPSNTLSPARHSWENLPTPTLARTEEPATMMDLEREPSRPTRMSNTTALP